MLLLPFMDNTIPTDEKVIPAAGTSIVTRDVPIPPRTDRLTISCKATTASSTKTITVTCQNVYGNVVGDAYTLGTIAATTSGVSLIKRLERDFSANFDPNASDLRITFAKTANIAVTINCNITANPSR